MSVNGVVLKSNSSKSYSTWMALLTGLLNAEQTMSLKILRREVEDIPNEEWRDPLLGEDEISIYIDNNIFVDRKCNWSFPEITVKTTDTILQVKTKIMCSDLNIPIRNQQLLASDTSVFQLKILDDNMTLADCGITEDGMRLKLKIINDDSSDDDDDDGDNDKKPAAAPASATSTTNKKQSDANLSSDDDSDEDDDDDDDDNEEDGKAPAKRARAESDDDDDDDKEVDDEEEEEEEETRPKSKKKHPNMPTISKR